MINKITYSGINKPKAFTLIEVLVATAITAVIATSVAFLFLQSTVLNREVKEKQTASRICQSRIEELRNMSFSEMTYQSEDILISKLPNGHRVTRIKESYGADIKEVVVEVTWTGRVGTKNVKLNTLIYNL
jgi:prepilin-type N-terminal cleavage/methylation domain-containing protein